MLQQLDCDPARDGRLNRRFIDYALDRSRVNDCNTQGNFHLRYPLTTALWLGARSGFGGFPGTLPNIVDGLYGPNDLENTFARCDVDRVLTDPLVTKNGLLTLPVGYPEDSRLESCQ